MERTKKKKTTTKILRIDSKDWFKELGLNISNWNLLKQCFITIIL